MFEIKKIHVDKLLLVNEISPHTNCLFLSIVYMSVVYPWICIVVIGCFLAYFSLFITHLSFVFILSINRAFLFFKNKQSSTERERERSSIVHYMNFIKWHFYLSVDLCRNVCDDRRWSNFNILTLFYRYKKKERERKEEREKEQHTRANINCEAAKKMMAVLLQSNSVTSIKKNLGRRRRYSLSLFFLLFG